ncbi:MAG: hypothetical protein NUV93_06590, partial [Firmicutes bacterium]|nr:hypothetical protein [Bacillota bacterium]
MKQRTLAAVLFALLAVSFAACTAERPAAPSPQPSGAVEPAKQPGNQPQGVAPAGVPVPPAGATPCGWLP